MSRLHMQAGDGGQRLSQVSLAEVGGLAAPSHFRPSSSSEMEKFCHFPLIAAVRAAPGGSGAGEGSQERWKDAETASR